MNPWDMPAISCNKGTYLNKEKGVFILVEMRMMHAVIQL